MLADYLPATISDRFEWVRDQGLVVRALNEILGNDGWAADARPFEQGGTRKWITVTNRAKPATNSMPNLPVDWLSDEEDSPPPDGGLF
jgi:hypothetical protein